MKTSHRVALGLAAALALAPALGACSRKRGDDGASAAEPRPLPPLTIKDDTPDLMLTWVDDKGDTHVEMRPADVPAAGRSRVRVVVSDREDGTRDLFYVADLNQKREDGSYAIQTVRRSDWETEIEKRREAYLAKSAPPRAAAGGDRPPGPAQEQGAPTVIIYGASWCGPCHQAADYLKARGVAYVMKDIEETPGAEAEMRAKLARSGHRGGSIPVIDVRGQILIGFSAAALDQALSRTPAGTML